MLTLPEFEFHTPNTLDEALAVLREHGENAKLVAGGTDILVNMKHRVTEPDVLVSLSSIEGLDFIEETPQGGLRLGALTLLSEIRDSPLIHRTAPVLAQAAGLIASPQIQNMGTLGGNLCLDTRCVYINQTYFWRQALGFCLKKDGTLCHVVKGGKRCVAAQSSDTVPPLMILNAEVEIHGPDGMRTAPVESLYKKDGALHLTMAADEILTAVHIPAPPKNLVCSYQKYRVRKAIDFPAMSMAIGVVFGDGDVAKEVRAAATCMGSFPRRIRKLDAAAAGKPLTEAVVNAIASHCHRQINPLDNILVDTAWRKEMVPVLTKRAIADIQTRRAQA